MKKPIVRKSKREITGDKFYRIDTRISQTMFEKLQQIAEEMNTTGSGVIRRLISSYEI